MAKTSTGFEYELQKGVEDDFELLMDIAEWDKGNIISVPSAIRRLLGPEQAKALIEHTRDENGKVSTERIMKEVMEMFQNVEETKNS